MRYRVVCRSYHFDDVSWSWHYNQLRNLFNNVGDALSDARQLNREFFSGNTIEFSAPGHHEISEQEVREFFASLELCVFNLGSTWFELPSNLSNEKLNLICDYFVDLCPFVVEIIDLA